MAVRPMGSGCPRALHGLGFRGLGLGVKVEGLEV